MAREKFKSKIKSKVENKEAEILKNQLARVLADYDNLRRRAEAEKEVWIRFSTERVLIRIIPVLDTLETAQEHLKDSGLAIAISEFKKVLDEEGIEEIKPKVGEEFNQNDQEAVESLAGGEEGKIAELIMPGWKFKQNKDLSEGRRVIRYAKVKVYGKNPQVGDK